MSSLESSCNLYRSSFPQLETIECSYIFGRGKSAYMFYVYFDSINNISFFTYINKLKILYLIFKPQEQNGFPKALLLQNELSCLFFRVKRVSWFHSVYIHTYKSVKFFYDKKVWRPFGWPNKGIFLARFKLIYMLLLSRGAIYNYSLK